MIWIQATSREGDVESVDEPNRKKEKEKTIYNVVGQLCHSGEGKQQREAWEEQTILVDECVIGEDYHRT